MASRKKQISGTIDVEVNKARLVELKISGNDRFFLSDPYECTTSHMFSG
jgi:hypothetical protein